MDYAMQRGFLNQQDYTKQAGPWNSKMEMAMAEDKAEEDLDIQAEPGTLGAEATDCGSSEQIDPEMHQPHLQAGSLRRRILVIICLLLELQVIITRVLQNQQAALVTMTNFTNLLYLLQGDGRVLRLRDRSVWRLDRMSPFVDKTLLGSHSEKEFTWRLRIKPTTFYYICSLVAPAMQMKKNTGGAIALEKKVALCLNRLGTGNSLLGCADLFGMSEALACIVVRDSCGAVMKFIRPLVVPKFNKDSLLRIAEKFEQKHGIPFIMGAIDGSHIPFIAPHGDPAPFYNRKGFYSCLLQGIIDTETVFWDWDFGWAGSLHDYTLFVNSWEGMKTILGDYLPYKLIGDAAYPFRTCMYVPFKGSKEQLDPVRAHWNFIQSSTRMCVERAFGVLKGRWRILLRRIEMRLDHVADVVGACICLHNLCIMHKDFVDDSMVQEAKLWLLDQEISSFGDLRTSGTMPILDYGKEEVSRVSIDTEGIIRQAGLPGSDPGEEVHLVESSSVAALKAGVTMHIELAKTLFHRQLRENVALPPGLYETDSDTSMT